MGEEDRDRDTLMVARIVAIVLAVVAGALVVGAIAAMLRAGI